VILAALVDVAHSTPLDDPGQCGLEAVAQCVCLGSCRAQSRQLLTPCSAPVFGRVPSETRSLPTATLSTSAPSARTIPSPRASTRPASSSQRVQRMSRRFSPPSPSPTWRRPAPLRSAVAGTRWSSGSRISLQVSRSTCPS
jgi:hypothetical protein